MIGAAFGAALVSNPSWMAGYESGGAGGLVGAVLEPVGGFGKFLTVMLALSVIANMVRSKLLGWNYADERMVGAGSNTI